MEGISQPCRSDSSDSSYGEQPHLVSVHSDEEECRDVPVPSSPIWETVTWEGPNAVIDAPKEITPSTQQNVMCLMQHVPSRRNSACDHPTAPVFQPPISREPVNSSAAPGTVPLCPTASSTVGPDFTRILNQKLTHQSAGVDPNNGAAGLDLPQLGGLRKLTYISAPVSVASDGLQDAL